MAKLYTGHATRNGLSVCRGPHLLLKSGKTLKMTAFSWQEKFWEFEVVIYIYNCTWFVTLFKCSVICFRCKLCASCKYWAFYVTEMSPCFSGFVEGKIREKSGNFVFMKYWKHGIMLHKYPCFDMWPQYMGPPFIAWSKVLGRREWKARPRLSWDGLWDSNPSRVAHKL